MAKGIWSKNRDPNDHGLIGNMFNRQRDPNDHGLIGNMFSNQRDPNDHGLIGNFVGGLFGRKRPTTNNQNDNFPTEGGTSV
jgi:hypothetical protein